MHPEGGMSLGVTPLVSLHQVVVAGSWKYGTVLAIQYHVQVGNSTEAV